MILHRVGGASGPVARDTTDPTGRFAFPRPPPPDTASDASGGPPVYVITARYAGVLYHGPPFSPSEADGAADPAADRLLRVYEPRVAASVTVEARHAVLRPVEDDVEVLDVYRLSAAGDSARVPPGPEAPGWLLPLPAGAAGVDLRVEPSGAGSARLEEGAVRVTGAVPPGGRSVMARYRLPGPDATLPAPAGSGPLEILVPAAAGPVTVEGAEPAGTAELEGRTYRRWRAAPSRPGDAEPGPAVVRFGGEAPRRAWAWGLLAAGLLLAAGAVASALALRRRTAAA